MKRYQKTIKYTPAEVRNDPYGFTYKEMSAVQGQIPESVYQTCRRDSQCQNLSRDSAV